MIRIGVVGTGRILNAHLRGFKTLRERGLGDFRITAIAARPGRIASAQGFCRRDWGEARHPVAAVSNPLDPLSAPYTPVSDFQPDLSARPFDDYRQMLADDVCDAVLDTTPVHLHHQVTCDALEAGKHVLVQKPMAITVAAARRMCDLAARRGLVLGQVETARYMESTRAQRWAFENDLLGRPQLAFMGAAGGRWSPDKITAGTHWRHLRLQAGGGAVLDIGPHFFHHFRYVLDDVVSVSGTARTIEPTRYLRDAAGVVVDQIDCDVDDTFVAVSQFASGAVGTFVWSWACHGQPMRIEGGPVFYGSKGSLKGDHMTLDDGTSGSLQERFRAEAGAAYLEQYFPAGMGDMFALNQYDWLRGIAEPGYQVETGADQGLRDVAACFAVLESSHAGRTVTLDEILAGKVDEYQRPLNIHYGL